MPKSDAETALTKGIHMSNISTSASSIKVATKSLMPSINVSDTDVVKTETQKNFAYREELVEKNSTGNSEIKYMYAWIKKLNNPYATAAYSSARMVFVQGNLATHDSALVIG